jgi:hypothetical protein
MCPNIFPLPRYFRGRVGEGAERDGIFTRGRPPPSLPRFRWAFREIAPNIAPTPRELAPWVLSTACRDYTAADAG